MRISEVFEVMSLPTLTNGDFKVKWLNTGEVVKLWLEHEHNIYDEGGQKELTDVCIEIGVFYRATIDGLRKVLNLQLMPTPPAVVPPAVAPPAWYSPKFPLVYIGAELKFQGDKCCVVAIHQGYAWIERVHIAPHTRHKLVECKLLEPRKSEEDVLVDEAMDYIMDGHVENNVDDVIRDLIKAGYRKC